MKIIAIVMGGYSSEFEISLQSGQMVYESLDPLTYKAYRVHIFKDGWFCLDSNNEKFPINKHDFSVIINNERIHFDCVFNAIHGSPGEDGFIQAYLKLLSIPYTGCDMYESALTFNKRDLLATLKPFNIKCAKNFYLNKGDDINENDIIKVVGLPCFVKANRAGSSFGISKVYEKKDLNTAIEKSFKEDNEIIIEEYLDGIEVSVGVITYQGKTTVLPITEIVSENDFFDYEAKYHGKSQEITPARISKELALSVTKEAERIYNILGLKGFSRSEFIFKNNEPHLLEVNTIPGLTAASILPQQAAKAGISLKDLFDNALQEALQK